MVKNSFQIFKTGSRTYFYSSIFFPQRIRSQVFTLYSFVRVLDDFVDATPQQKKEFNKFTTSYYQALQSKKITGNPLIDNFINLQHVAGFEQSWIDSFIESMTMDLDSRSYNSMTDTLGYMYGSAEVIGLMMAKIMKLPKQATQSAQLLGRAMQYVNFIRDIQEDIELNRSYFPQKVLAKYHLSSLEYNSFIRDQIDLYQSWNQEAHDGFKYIPRRLRIPISTASAMYSWTAKIIYADPLMVYCKKVKPSKRQIFKQILIETFTI
jgi:phytoene synthase